MLAVYGSQSALRDHGWTPFGPTRVSLDRCQVWPGLR